MNYTASSFRGVAIAVFVTLSAGGCLLGPEHYYGTYTVTCAEFDAPAIRDETQRVANLASKQLGRPLLSAASNPGDVTLYLAVPPTSSVTFYSDVTSPKSFDILIRAPDPAESPATHDVRGVIESILNQSQCKYWKYRVKNTSLAGG